MAYFRKRVYAGYMPAAKRRRVDFTPKAVRRFQSINKRTTKGPYSRGPVRSQLRSLQRVVRDLKPEIKYFDLDTDFTNVTTAGAIAHITAIAAGTDISNRTADLINVVSVNLQYAVRGFNSTDTYRLAIVVDKQQVSDTAPAVTDIFSTTDPIGAMPNLNSLERFRFIYLSPFIEGNRVQGETPGVFEFQWRGNVKVSFNGTADTDISKNGFYLVFLSDGTGNTVDVEATTRIGFTDV